MVDRVTQSPAADSSPDRTSDDHGRIELGGFRVVEIK